MDTPLISCAALRSMLDDPQLVILDASQQREPDNMQLQGARYFDIKNEFSEPGSEFPNTLPTPEYFEEKCRQLGINSTSRIVVYDNKGIFSSPRVWWMFKIMGHQNVAVLDGGLPEWKKEGYPTTTDNTPIKEKGDFNTRFNQKMIKDYDFMVANTNTSEALVIDARSEGRFLGTAPEPRKGLRSGSIPNSCNLPYTMVLDNGKFKNRTELAAIFKELSTEQRPFVFSCGSGITACIILLACELVMEKENAVYDGSWTEWATLNTQH